MVAVDVSYIDLYVDGLLDTDSDCGYSEVEL